MSNRTGTAASMNEFPDLSYASWGRRVRIIGVKHKPGFNAR